MSIAERTGTLDTVPQRVPEQVRRMPPPPMQLRTSVSRTPRRWNLLSVIGLLAAACCFWQSLPAVSSLWKDQAQANVAPAPVGLHSFDGIDKVTRRLRRAVREGATYAERKQGILNALDEMANLMKTGNFLN